VYTSPPGNNTAVTPPRYRMTYGCIIPGRQIVGLIHMNRVVDTLDIGTNQSDKTCTCTAIKVLRTVLIFLFILMHYDIMLF
jgi:hypothetical protein